MTSPFKVGEWYTTRGGEQMKVIDVDPSQPNNLVVFVRCANGAVYTRHADGTYCPDMVSPIDLMPPKRVVWANFYSIGIGHYFDTEDEARDTAASGAIAVAVRVELP